jgi:hypothetical protein
MQHKKHKNKGHTKHAEAISSKHKIQIRRIRTMALETYKIVNKLAPVCLHDLVNVKNSKYAFRYSNILDVPQVRTTRYGKKSFMFAAAKQYQTNIK